eukprot:5314672-Ditylum_brightwellii.AAC.2
MAPSKSVMCETDVSMPCTLSHNALKLSALTGTTLVSGSHPLTPSESKLAMERKFRLTVSSLS